MIDREFVLTALLLFASIDDATPKTIDVPTTVKSDERMTQVNLNEEHSLELLQHWLDQALGGLMGALATVKLEEVHDDDKEEHAQCAKNATNVIDHAKCTVQLIDKKRAVLIPSKNATSPPATTTSSTTTTIPVAQSTMETILSSYRDVPMPMKNRLNINKLESHNHLKTNNINSKIGRIHKRKMGKKRLHHKDKDVSWVGSFGQRQKRQKRQKRSLGDFDFEAFLAKLPDPNRKRGKTTTTTTTVVPREIRRAPTYTLRDAQQGTPFGRLAVSIKNSVLKAKHKTTSKDWITVIKEIRDETKKLKARKALRKMFTKKIASMQEGYGNKTKVNERRPLAMKDLDELDEMNPREMLDEAHRIENSLTGTEKIMREPLKLMRDAVKLGLMAAGKNISDFADKTLRLISPRLLPVMAEDEAAEDDQVALLSPSLFALHNEGKGIEKATSLVDGLGLAKTKEHMAWLDLVMEASGVTDAVEYLKDEKIKKALTGIMGEDEMRSPTGQPLYFTKKNVSDIFGGKETKKIDTFEKLQGTYTPEQVEEQKKRGFALLNKDQLEIVYGKDSPYASEERLETLKKIPKEDMHGHIVNNIRAMAEMESFKVRKKDVFFSPVIFVPLIFQSVLVSGPIILSPLVFSPSILTPAVLGPVILSPWVFIPVILSPRALSPLIVNPLIFSPVILSPLVLHPFILAPGVFNPFILSPLALSPFILSPQVFSPAILSPFVLNPFIGTPTVGSPLILSPFALSPIILSPQIMFAAILSPFVLSPLPYSPLIFAEVVLSPSALS